MIKIVANVGAWQTLYCTASPTAKLKHFELPNDWRDGVVEGMAIRTVTSLSDSARWGVKKHFVVLISERPEYAALIAFLLRSDLGPELKAIVSADRITEIVDQNASLARYCEGLEREFATASGRKEKMVRTLRAWQVILFIVCVILCLGQIFLWTRAGPKGDKGDLGSPGETRYLVIRDEGVKVGDIILVDESDVAMPEYLKCDGRKIRKEQFPDYFAELALSVQSTSLPKLEAPKGHVYLIKVH